MLDREGVRRMPLVVLPRNLGWRPLSFFELEQLIVALDPEA